MLVSTLTSHVTLGNSLNHLHPDNALTLQESCEDEREQCTKVVPRESSANGSSFHHKQLLLGLVNSGSRKLTVVSWGAGTQGVNCGGDTGWKEKDAEAAARTA